MSSPSNQFFTVDCGPESEVNFINQRGGKQINKQKKKHYKIHRKRWRRLRSILQARCKRSLSLDYPVVAAFCSKEKIMNRSTLSYARKHEAYLISWSTLLVLAIWNWTRGTLGRRGFSSLVEECFVRPRRQIFSLSPKTWICGGLSNWNHAWNWSVWPTHCKRVSDISFKSFLSLTRWVLG